MISIVLPVYNCYDKLLVKLPELKSMLQNLNTPFEIIIIDDGSENKLDITSHLDENCRVLINPKNYGKGYSVKRGMLASSGDHLIFMDGDFPFDMDVVERMYKKLKLPAIDIVIGDRTMAGSSYAEATWLRSAGSKVISFIVSRFVTRGYYDTQCGIKGFKREAALDIFSKLTINGFSFDVEVIFIAIKRKYRIERIAVTINKQLSSNVKVIFHGLEMMINFFRIKVNYRIGRYN